MKKLPLSIASLSFASNSVFSAGLNMGIAYKIKKEMSNA